MFTGIIQEVGAIDEVVSLGGGIRLTVKAPSLAGRLKVNDSIAINGVCQTVVERRGELFDVVAVEETLKKTAFGRLRSGNGVNLELPLRVDDLLGGHLVLGHVDTVATILSVERRVTSTMYEIGLPEKMMHYLVHTGSVSVDGVSLTVAELGAASFRVSIIPHTIEKTIFGTYREQSVVNIEFDVIGKYIERMLRGGIRPVVDGTAGGSQTIDRLRENGY
jgi:riboflavin synthase